MKRRLFNLATAVSLVVCASVFAEWVVDRNTTVSRELDCGVGRYVWGVYLAGGEVFCARFETRTPVGHPSISFRRDHGWSLALYCMAVLYERNGPLGRLHGFGAGSWSGRPAHELFAAARVVMFPSWLAIAVFAVAPTIWSWRFIKETRRRRIEGAARCATCGYDLRATPDRCPECGMAVAPKPAEAAA